MSAEAALLQEIVAQQKRQIEMQTESLALQRQHLGAVEAQLARVERVNARAELIQARANRALRVVVWMLIPFALLLAVLMLWPYVRHATFLLAH